MTRVYGHRHGHNIYFGNATSVPHILIDTEGGPMANVTQTKPLAEPYQIHPTGEFMGTVTEWDDIRPTRSGVNFYAKCEVKTQHGTLRFFLHGMPNTLTLLRSFMPPGSEHTIVVKHEWHGGRLYARASFKAEVQV